MSDRIVLGSGDLYVAEYNDAIPEDSTLEVEANRIGYIKGGATLSYSSTSYKAIDDMGKVSKTITTDEEATLKSGIMTWNGETLKKLCSRARVTTTSTKRTVKIGGGVDDGKKYVIRFHHPDPVDGDIRVTIVGRNEAGFELAFAKDAETVIDAEFTAFPHDTDGTLIQIDEEIPS